MKTKDLMIYSISSYRPKKHNQLHTLLKKSLLHKLFTFLVLFSFFGAQITPLRVFSLQSDGISDVTFDAVADVNAEAVSSSGAPVTFPLPIATEYNSLQDATGTAVVTCDKTSGDIFQLGTTTVTCTGTGVMDTSITAQKQFVISILDTTAPVVTLLGTSPMDVSLHDTFTDPGATALDLAQGDLSSSVVASGTVDTGMLGTYDISYEVSDNAHNTGSIHRIVNVVDASSTPVTFNLFASAGLGGSISPIGTTTVASGTDQLYTITPDSNYEIDTVTVDGTSTLATSSYLFSGVTTDHTIAASFQSIASSTDITPPTGPTLITSPTNALNQISASSTVAMDWDDASDMQSLVDYSFEFDHEATTTPDVITETNATTTATTLSNGTWYFHVRVVDSAGNGGMTIHYGPFTILTPDTTAPSVPILTVTKTASSTLLSSWTVATDDRGVAGYGYSIATSSTILPGSVVQTASTSIETTLPDGFWYVKVKAIDTSGNEGETATTTPMLIDTHAPTLTLYGPSEVTLNTSEIYNELGAQAIDAIDGDVSSRILVSGSVDTHTIGDYTLTYQVTDLSGNVGVSVTRIVHVVLPPDTTPPTAPTVVLTKTASSTLALSWSGASDDRGITDYKYSLTQGSSTIPTISIGMGASVTLSVADGIWYGAVTALDAAGNQSSVGTSTGVLIDTTVPVVTLLGPSSATLMVGDSYVDSGATAIDSHDGDITGSVTMSGTVDAQTVGDYTLTYTVSDSSGNTAVPAQRVVRVIPDTISPSMPSATLAKTASSSLDLSWRPSTDNREVSSYDYTFSTSTSALPVQNVSSSTLSASSSVPDGIWYGFVRSVDTSGNISTTTRTNSITVDTTLPVLTLLGNASTSVYLGFPYSDAGVTALDSMDGDLTGSVIVTGSVDTTTLGDYTLVYHVSDVSGNSAIPVQRFVHVILTPDVTAPSTPVVNLSKTGSSTMRLSWTPVTDDRGVASYSYSISTSTTSTPSIVLSSTTTMATVTVPDGTWYGFVSAKDTSNNISLIGTSSPVHIDTVLPVLTLLGNASTSVYLGFPYSDAGATALDESDGDISGNIITTGIVDTSTLGDYTLTYTVSDLSGNAGVPITRVVHVVLPPDTLAPVITLNGSSTVSVYQGRVYQELGATALDSRDGDVSSHIVTMGIPDTQVLGHYTVTYTVSDLTGNVATSTRGIDIIPLVYYQIDSTVTGGKGIISGSSTASVAVNDAYTMTFVPNNGYEVSALSLDGISQSASSSLALTNVTAAHHVAVAFSPLSVRNTYTVNVSHSGRGSTSQATTTTMFEGEDTDITFTPAYLYDVGVLTVNGQNVATTTLYHITNASSSYSINASFAPTVIDVTPPSNPIATSSLPVKTIENTDTINFSWDPSVDNLAGVEGYSYVFDSSPFTVPDDGVDTASTTLTEVRPYGTYYLHLKALDYLGNASEVSHLGPFLLSDSHVYLEDSTVGTRTIAGILAPTLAEANVLGLTGTATVIRSTLLGTTAVDNASIRDSLLNRSRITQSTVSSSTLVGSLITTSSLSQSAVSSTTILDGQLNASTIGSSTLKHIRGAGAHIGNDIAYEGVFLMPDGNNYTLTLSLPISDVENDDPVAKVTPFVTHDYIVTFVSNTIDKDLHEGVFGDTWFETFDFGDGSPVLSTTTRTLTSQFNHNYGHEGDYHIRYTVKDLFGSTSEVTSVFHLDPYSYITSRGSGGQTEIQRNVTPEVSQPVTLPKEVEKKDDVVVVKNEEQAIRPAPPEKMQEVKLTVKKGKKVNTVKKTSATSPLEIKNFSSKVPVFKTAPSNASEEKNQNKKFFSQVGSFLSRFLPW